MVSGHTAPVVRQALLLPASPKNTALPPPPPRRGRLQLRAGQASEAEAVVSSPSPLLRPHDPPAYHRRRATAPHCSPDSNCLPIRRRFGDAATAVAGSHRTRLRRHLHRPPTPRPSAGVGSRRPPRQPPDTSPCAEAVGGGSRSWRPRGYFVG